MSAATTVLQLVRAHYNRDEPGFASAANTLARQSKAPTIKAALINAVRQGYRSSYRNPDPSQGSTRPPGTGGPKLQESRGALQRVAPLTFDELLLDAELQLFLDEIVEELQYREELEARKLRARNRLLFWGPPGNGKTSSAGALAHSLDVAAYAVHLPQVVSMYMGGTSQNLGELFASLSPETLIVFDELDAMGASRGAVDQAAGKEMNAIVNTMLTLLDRHKDGIIVATTNRPDILDPALLRRFDELVEFPAPNVAQKRALSARLCERYEIEPIGVDNCANFDAVTKTVEREARRIVMRELLAAEAEENQQEEQAS